MTIAALTVVQFICGFGLLSLFRMKLKLSLIISLSLMCGVGVLSFVPFLLQLLYIPLTAVHLIITIFLLSVALNLRSREGLVHLRKELRSVQVSFRLYELP